MENKEETRYIYLGDTLNLPEFKFTKGGVYYGEKIEELRERYPLLKRIMIDTEELPNFKVNDTLIESLAEELRQEAEGVKN